jgi:uncharacterized protein (TIGR00299 family) protein
MRSDAPDNSHIAGPSSHARRDRGRVLFIEPFSGISGDMFLGALLDLGIDLSRLEQKLRLLPLTGYRLAASSCSRAGIQAVKFDVHLEEHRGRGHLRQNENQKKEPHYDSGPQEQQHEGHKHEHLRGRHEHGHRSFKEICSMIETSGLSDWIKQKSVETFRKLAEAEGKIHNQHPDDVHFHEVGAIDSIVDIVGAAIAVEELLPVRLFSAAVNIGQGTLECRHGVYPAPGPAAMELLKGVPVYSASSMGELATPTGAALLISMAESFGPRPLMRVDRIGYGAGGRDIPGVANVLRVTLGEEIADGLGVSASEPVAVIEATLDDMSPQVYGYFQEKAMAAGALDVYAIPAQMKKNRPGMELTLVCSPDRIDEMTTLIFRETTTIGLRYMLAQRKTLEREFQEVSTEFGAVRIKVSYLNGRRVNFAPEYECCRRLAQEKGVPLKDVMAAASRAYQELGRIY